MSEKKPKRTSKSKCPPSISPCELIINEAAAAAADLKKPKGRVLKPFDEMTYEERCEEHRLKATENKFKKKCDEKKDKKRDPCKKS